SRWRRRARRGRPSRRRTRRGVGSTGLSSRGRCSSRSARSSPPARAVEAVGLRAVAVGLVAALPAAGAWRSEPPLPVPRGEVAAAVIGSEIAVVGGFLAGGQSSARVDAYAPGARRWRRLPDLPQASTTLSPRAGSGGSTSPAG